jgi:prepilin signal peptidase PulO-like enzyme (type II secretory pathway)
MRGDQQRTIGGAEVKCRLLHVRQCRSAGPCCGTPLGAVDLVPLVSFLLLHRRCRHCRTPIGLFHPAVELAAVAVAV